MFPIWELRPACRSEEQLSRANLISDKLTFHVSNFYQPLKRSLDSIAASSLQFNPRLALSTLSFSVSRPNNALKITFYIIIISPLIYAYYASVFSQKIKHEEDFNFIQSIIPNVTIILRHIWTMSDYYSEDRNMLNLLGQISYVFAEKVKILINVDTIFK